MSKHETIKGVTFIVWEQSFAVSSPFHSQVIYVGKGVKLEDQMRTVADIVDSARRFQHTLDKEALNDLGGLL